jgi:hypothetical protein
MFSKDKERLTRVLLMNRIINGWIWYLYVAFSSCLDAQQTGLFHYKRPPLVHYWSVVRRNILMDAMANNDFNDFKISTAIYTHHVLTSFHV